MKKALIALMSLALVAAFSVPAMAESEVTFGGYVAFDTWIQDVDEPVQDLDADGAFDDGRYDDTDLLWALDSVCSRFNVTFKRDDFTGFVEIRPRNGSYFRHWYSEWNFGAGFLLVGQTWLPSFVPISASSGPLTETLGAGGCSFGFGDTGTGVARAEMIRLRFPFTMGDFKLSLSNPRSAGVDTGDELGIGADEADTTLPKVEANLNLNFGPVGFNIFGSWREYEDVYRDLAGNNEIQETEFDIESYVVGANMKLAMGPFGLALAGWIGENAVDNGFLAGSPDLGSISSAIYDVDNDGILDTVEDTDDWGAYITATFKLNDMLSFAAGGGILEQDATHWNAPNGDPLPLETEASHWYVNATVTLAEGFSIKPEIGEYDYGDDTVWTANDPNDAVGRDQGDNLYYGMWWQMVF